jgi:hypothetical protein
MKSTYVRNEAIRNEAIAIAAAVGSCALAFVVVMLADWEFGGITDIGNPVMMLVLLPVGVYFVASGRITELAAFGVAAKVAKTAKESVKPEMIPYDDLQIVGLRKLQGEIDQSRPGVMKMTIGRKVPYTVEDLKLYYDALSQLRSFKLVVFLGNDKRVVAYMEDWVFKEQVEQNADRFVQLINSGRVEDFTGVAKKTISINSTNIEALRTMQEQNLETLVIVDEQTILRGVVERVQLLSNIMLSLAP